MAAEEQEEEISSHSDVDSVITCARSYRTMMLITGRTLNDLFIFI